MLDSIKMPTVTFCTFCCSKDAHLLHAPGQLKKQIDSNLYDFDEIIVVHQKCGGDYPPFDLAHPKLKLVYIWGNDHIDEILEKFSIDLSKPQYVSDTDKHHQWKFHVVNHLQGIRYSHSDYTLFADNDCWMVPPINWIDFAIRKLEGNSHIFIVSPNDGEPERQTFRMSQQMFLCGTDEFRKADFNQPGFDGDVTKLDTMPEYAGMLEGRMEFHCRKIGKVRYVCPPEFRYWHHNRMNEEGHFEIDYSKY